MTALSIVVPVLNEEESLRELVRQIREHAADAEIVFVDDGSTDASWDVITTLAGEDGGVHGVRFRRNFGKAAAVTAGLRTSTGERVVLMDADLQDDPAEIPKFMAALDEGADVVNGWKVRRLDPWHKVYPSKVFNALVSSLTGLRLHDHNCGLKAFRRDVADDLHLYGEMHRFIPVLAHARGYRVTEREVHHRPREFGHSKYGVRRFLRGFLDLLTVAFLTSYGRRPQHLLGAFGLFFFALGVAGLTWLAGVWILTQAGAIDAGPIGSRPLLAYSVGAAIIGFQALSLGLLAELIVANTHQDRDGYSVRATVGDARLRRASMD